MTDQAIEIATLRDRVKQLEAYFNNMGVPNAVQLMDENSAYVSYVSTLRAQLEKCKEQRNEALEKFNYDNLHVEKSTFYKTEVSRLDAELEALK